LIDSRNRISLSRLQITLWSILVLPAFLAIALPRSLPNGTENPLNIALPVELVTALGISTASLAGSSLVKSNKSTKESRVVIQLQDQVEQAQAEVTAKTQQVNQLTSDAAATWTTLKAQTADAEIVKQSLKGQVVQAKADLGQAEQRLQASQENLQQVAEMPREGLIKTNRIVTDASLMDLFTGDEIGNFDRVDLSKVQMFLLTIVVLVAYSAALYDLLLDQAAVFDPAGISLPLFSASISTLLVISHGGYLAVKAVDHSKAA
jgi:multidrug efflux pump subunit AcrA (membrane-fusion protein)